MMGLFVLCVIALWCLLVFLAARGVFQRLSGRRLRWPLALLAFAALLVLPVLDEVVGGREFAALCEANGGITVDRDKAFGRTVYEARASYREVPGTLLPVRALQADFIDIDSGEKVLGFRQLQARGGWLSGVLLLSENHVPLTFNGNCNPGGGGRLPALYEELHMTFTRTPKQARAPRHDPPATP